MKTWELEDVEAAAVAGSLWLHYVWVWYTECNRLTEATARDSKWSWPTCMAIGSGARGLSVSRECMWRVKRSALHFSHDWLMCGDCELGSAYAGRMHRESATGWLLSVDCWQTLTVTCCCCCCARMSAITYMQRQLVWIPNNIRKFQCFILFKYQKWKKNNQNFRLITRATLC